MKHETLSPYVKLIIALGEFAPSVAVGTILPFYFLFFMTDIAHVSPGLAGTVLLVARLWDAVNDPLVGNVSDRTRSRLGRRRPYMLFGAVPMGVLFALLWLVPPLGDFARGMYYMVVYFLFDAAFTVVSGPYAALTPEITLDADERTSLITWRMAVSIITGLVAAVAMDIVFSAVPNLQVGFVVMGGTVGFISILPFLWVVAVVRERPEFQQREGVQFFDALWCVLTNRPFWLALMTDAFAWVSVAIVSGAFAYFLIYWGGIPEEDTPIIMAVILASAALFLPLVNWLSERFEKKWAYVISTATWALVHIALWFVPQFQVMPIYVIAAIAGLGVSSAHVLPGAMSVDVLESVELASGQRQEGVFTGVSNFFRKLGISLALFGFGWMLELTGYVPNAPVQPPATLIGIRVVITWVPAVLLGLAILAGVAFPITRNVHSQMVAELDQRRAASD